MTSTLMNDTRGSERNNEYSVNVEVYMNTTIRVYTLRRRDKKRVVQTYLVVWWIIGVIEIATWGNEQKSDGWHALRQ